MAGCNLIVRDLCSNLIGWESKMSALHVHKKWEPFKGRWRWPKPSRPVETKTGQFALEESAEIKYPQETGNNDLQKHDFQHCLISLNSTAVWLALGKWTYTPHLHLFHIQNFLRSLQSHEALDRLEYILSVMRKLAPQYSHSKCSANNDIALPHASAPRGGHALPGNGQYKMEQVRHQFAREIDVYCHSNAHVHTWE